MPSMVVMNPKTARRRTLHKTTSHPQHSLKNPGHRRSPGGASALPLPMPLSPRRWSRKHPAPEPSAADASSTLAPSHIIEVEAHDTETKPDEAADQPQDEEPAPAHRRRRRDLRRGRGARREAQAARAAHGPPAPDLARCVQPGRPLGRERCVGQQRSRGARTRGCLSARARTAR
ncbi:hypothetical protein NUW54_g13655 [Trametes sanguinea]|uniref:Uncharacterized protein n=1 Tax=Trametes sanguinea TaxID=158606 RepID=A0ACC1MKY9_9APHY|nr:hypothetical protein NUW54_g13655 [Trametes sanguinea]